DPDGFAQDGVVHQVDSAHVGDIRRRRQISVLYRTSMAIGKRGVETDAELEERSRANKDFYAVNLLWVCQEDIEVGRTVGVGIRKCLAATQEGIGWPFVGIVFVPSGPILRRIYPSPIVAADSTRDNFDVGRPSRRAGPNHGIGVIWI